MVDALPQPQSQPLPAPSRASGFTLIEMLVVMTLIALLLTLAVPRYFHSIDNGKLTVQRQNLATVRDAIDKFHADLGRYPDTLEELVARKYLRQVPLDPMTEAASWTIVAPPESAQGNVYDVIPVGAAASAPLAGPAIPGVPLGAADLSSATGTATSSGADEVGIAARARSTP